MRSTPFNRTASWIVIGLFGATFALSLFVPNYTDEITIKLTRVQVLLDGFELTSLYPQCGPAFSLHVPWSWIPGAFIDWGIYGNVTEPIFLRIIGMSTFIVWLGMLAWFIRRNLKAEISSLHIIAGLISFVTLGVLPFLLVLNRSEQPLLVGLTLIGMLPYIVAHYQPRTNLAWILIVVIFCLTTSYMFSSHPKTFFFIPLMLVSALHLSVTSKRVWMGVVMLVSLALVCYDSLIFWTSYLNCPDAPLLDTILKSQSLSIGTLFSAPKEFVLAGLRSLAHSSVYIKNVLFEWSYQSDWLPSRPDQKLDWFSGLNDVDISLIYLSTVGYAIFALARKLRACLLANILVPETTIPFALFIGIFSCSFFLVAKNFYESALILPLFLLLVVLLLPALLETNQDSRVRLHIFKFLLIASIASQVNLILTFVPYVTGTWLAGGQVAGQVLSVSPFNYKKTREDAIAAAANCGITVNNLNTHLVIDDSTYFPFKDAYRPFHVLYISRVFGKDIGDRNLIQFLKEKNSAGVITRCDDLSPENLKFTIKHANYCCISQQEINTLGANIQTRNK